MAGHRSPRAPIRLVLLLTLAFSQVAASAPAASESLHYVWHLQGFLGAIAALFFPSEGEGSLSLTPLPNGHLQSELTVTAPKTANADFFRYGAEMDPANGETVRVWSASLWRGERRQKEAPVGRAGVFDVASSIFRIRSDPPQAPRQMEIWSDGRLYPVVVVPLETATRKVGARSVEARHYSVRGVEVEGRRFWKGELELWLATDERATPVEIVVARSGARVRLSLVDGA